MNDKPDGKLILALLSESLPSLMRRFPLRGISLNGSTARGDAGPGSDVDLIVDVDPSIGLGIVDLCDSLNLILDGRADIITSGALDDAFRDSIRGEVIDVR